MASEWNSDMSAAPRDGTIVLLYSSDKNMVDAGYWRRVSPGIPPQGWWETTGGDHWTAGDPTHWMPLPPALGAA